jgi:hypothetical protein
MIPFWGNLTEIEAQEYQRLSKLVGRWTAWCALKKKERENTPKPYEPSNEEFLNCELLAMKGWGMLNA